MKEDRLSRHPDDGQRAALRKQAEINGLGIATTMVYDAAGRQTALVDGRNHRWTFVYDKGGRKTAEINPLLGVITYAYDADGRQTLRIDPRGLPVTYTYSAVGKQTGIQYPDGTLVTATYDPVGNRVLAQDSTGTYTRTYDALNRISVSIQPHGGRLSFAWDAVGQRQSMTDLWGHLTTYTHDANGNLLTLTTYDPTDPTHTLVTTYTYDPAGQRIKQEFANGTITQFYYDNAGRETIVGFGKSDPSILCWYTMTSDQWSTLTSDQWNTLPAFPIAATGELSYTLDKAGRRIGRKMKRGQVHLTNNGPVPFSDPQFLLDVL